LSCSSTDDHGALTDEALADLTDAYQRWRASGLDRITKSLEKELIRGWAHWLIPEDRL
jgi:hypothetical protein